MTYKRLICPERRRTVPSQFSWLDHRLVRDGYIDRCDPNALALYLILVTVADAEGLSYYADVTLGIRLSLPQPALQQARQTLIAAQLIAYQRPLYQVLALDATRPATDTQQARRHEVRTQANRPVALTELFKRMAGDGTDPRQSKGAPHDQL
jgi:hypothetical protein